ncbi:MAG: hypothetical protein LAN84_00380 [Acidobacteriia bacterium]|nr:hypothetical protein [Terriglobia bacterium]
MPCSYVKLPDGTIAIVKHAAERAPRCKFCTVLHDGSGTQPATQLCDFEIARTLGGDPITCDARVCVRCARRVGDKDFCPNHSG